MSSISVDASEVIALASRMAGAEPIIRQCLLQGVDRAGKLVEGSAKGNAPVRTGHLRRSITSRAEAVGSGAQAIVGTAVPYARWVEEGRGPVVARRGRFLRFEIGGRVIYARQVGPARGQWYMKRALQSNRGTIIRILRKAARDAAAAVIGGAR